MYNVNTNGVALHQNPMVIIVGFSIGILTIKWGMLM